MLSIHPGNLTYPLKLMIGRLSFWDCLFLGAMLNFWGVSILYFDDTYAVSCAHYVLICFLNASFDMIVLWINHNFNERKKLSGFHS